MSTSPPWGGSLQYGHVLAHHFIGATLHEDVLTFDGSNSDIFSEKDISLM